MSNLPTLAIRLCGISLALSAALSGKAFAQSLEPANYDPDRDGTFANLFKPMNFFTDGDGKLLIIEHDRKGPRKPYAPLSVLRTRKEIAFPDGSTSKGNANAFLVSPCFALTNYHAVFGKATPPTSVREVEREFSVDFTVVDESDRMSKVIKATPIKWGSFYDSDFKIRTDDWALLRLNECWGEEIGWIDTKRVTDTEMVGAQVHGSFYLDGKAGDKITTGIPCTITSIVTGSGEKGLLNSCSSRPGTSGSPLFIVDNGIPYAFAMQAAELNRDATPQPFSEERANVAIDLDIVFDSIWDVVEADKVRFLKKIANVYRKERGSEIPSNYNPAHDPKGSLRH